MNVRYAISLWNFFHGSDMPDLAGTLAFIRHLNCGVELWGWWGGQRGLYAPEHRPMWREALGDMPVSMHSAIVHNAPAHFEQIETAEALGVEVLVVHSDEFFVAGRRELDIPLLRDVVSFGAERQVTVALENGQLPILTQAAAEVPTLKFCLDVGHVYLTDAPMKAFLDLMGERLVHLHIQDILSPAEQDLPNTGQDHYLPGTGGIPAADWQLLRETLTTLDYDGTAVFEVRPRNPYQLAVLGVGFLDHLLGAAG